MGLPLPKILTIIQWLINGVKCQLKHVILCLMKCLQYHIYPYFFEKKKTTKIINHYFLVDDWWFIPNCCTTSSALSGPCPSPPTSEQSNW